MKHICVFCGSSSGERPTYADAARRFGAALARRRLGLVYGGGHIGLMGAVADAVLENGGTAVGVIPRFLVEKELAHRGLTELVVVDTMHQRKAVMAERADAFAVLPGGFGTGDELFEILTWAQLGLHTAPIGLLSVAGFFDPLLSWLDHCVREGFVRSDDRSLLLHAADADALLEMLMHRLPGRNS
ncbi:MAG TPA: TIGR00730 family Rossman fold protein [Gemmataceae bacterium]|nr:TIGR00730 family Rossman fold protein [Gemmataceae bacterium]